MNPELDAAVAQHQAELARVAEWQQRKTAEVDALRRVLAEVREITEAMNNNPFDTAPQYADRIRDALDGAPE